jgi:hypothetical protein
LTPPSILPLGKIAPKVKIPSLNTRIESESSSVLLDLLNDLEPLIREEGRKSAKSLFTDNDVID